MAVKNKIGGEESRPLSLGGIGEQLGTEEQVNASGESS